MCRKPHCNHIWEKGSVPIHFPSQLVITGVFTLTITWTTKSFWILASCRRVLSVRSFPEKNHLWRDTSISSCSCSCFLSSLMVSAMLAVRRTSFPEKQTNHKWSRQRFLNTLRRQWKAINYTSDSSLDEIRWLKK